MEFTLLTYPTTTVERVCACAQDFLNDFKRGSSSAPMGHWKEESLTALGLDSKVDSTAKTMFYLRKNPVYKEDVIIGSALKRSTERLFGVDWIRLTIYDLDAVREVAGVPQTHIPIRGNLRGWASLHYPSAREYELRLTSGTSELSQQSAKELYHHLKGLEARL